MIDEISSSRLCISPCMVSPPLLFIGGDYQSLAGLWQEPCKPRKIGAKACLTSLRPVTKRSTRTAMAQGKESEEAAAENLRLIALDAEDLAVLAAHLQDAILRVGDMIYLADEQRFV